MFFWKLKNAVQRTNQKRRCSIHFFSLETKKRQVESGVSKLYSTGSFWRPTLLVQVTRERERENRLDLPHSSELLVASRKPPLGPQGKEARNEGTSAALECSGIIWRCWLHCIGCCPLRLNALNIRSRDLCLRGKQRTSPHTHGCKAHAHPHTCPREMHTSRKCGSSTLPVFLRIIFGG